VIDVDVSELEHKWSLISDEHLVHGYKSLRLSAGCFSELFLGVDPMGMRCLILVLPKGYTPDFKPVEKEKLSIALNRDPNCLVLMLRDNGYFDLFDDLVISLYRIIKDISDAETYTKVFVESFNKWSAFFDDEIANRLSENDIKGLFGELSVLSDLLENVDANRINDLLESWKGPYDTGHDFELDDKDIEVKTINAGRASISISSKVQLEETHGKGLDLIVLSVERDLLDGISLKDQFRNVKNVAVGKGGDTAILFRAIKQKGLTQGNLHEYDNYRFALRIEEVFDCLREGFPRLTIANVPESITKVKYDLSLAGIDGFKISKREF
jgi:hypothetical protein